MFFRKKNKNLRVSFATSCYEKDWEYIIKDGKYLKIKMIGNHLYPFQERILIINNVSNYSQVALEAKKRVEEGVLTHFYIAKDLEKEVLDFFNLKREAFKAYPSFRDDWVFYNALGVLTAIYVSRLDYFLFHTGDVYLDKPVDWIEDALDLMEKREDLKVANLLWNNQYDEAKRESYRTKKSFFISESGFSDQQFLVKREDFRAPIYSEIREDSHHYPRGDVFEKRVFSFMKNHKWKRIIYRHGSYIHESF